MPKSAKLLTLVRFRLKPNFICLCGEMADAIDSKSITVMCGGSSPSRGIFIVFG